jgi:hypothetical protein
MQNKPYDLVLVAHEKDFNNIAIIIKYACLNLFFDNIHLILSERQKYKDLNKLKQITNKNIYIHIETDILKIDKTRIKYRPNWMYQMLLKFFNNVTSHNNYLVIEADSVIIKPLEFFENDKAILYLGRDQNHKPYYDFNKRILNIGREYNHSFIAEFIMYDRIILHDLLFKTNCRDVKDFLELIYQHVDINCYMADYELYGNFIYTYHNDKFVTKKLNSYFSGREIMQWTTKDFEDAIVNNQDKDVISCHCWQV